HHLFVVQIGRELERRFPEISVRANLFSDHKTFSRRQKRKFVPDLILTGTSSGSQVYAYVEVERTMKKKTRYRERWVDYDCDPHLDSCVYWVFEREVGEKLRKLMIKHFRSEHADKEFKLGVLYDKDYTLDPTGKIVQVADFVGDRKETLENAL